MVESGVLFVCLIRNAMSCDYLLLFSSFCLFSLVYEIRFSERGKQIDTIKSLSYDLCLMVWSDLCECELWVIMGAWIKFFRNMRMILTYFAINTTIPNVTKHVSYCMCPDSHFQPIYITDSKMMCFFFGNVMLVFQQ